MLGLSDAMAQHLVVRHRRVTNGEANKLSLQDRPVHDWYRFVLSFPPHLVRDYLQRFGITASHRVLDPFCGTGTTLVECKKLGIPSVGVEANPMACFASRRGTYRRHRGTRYNYDAISMEAGAVSRESSSRCTDNVGVAAR